jgi:hypothetical protein
MPKSLTVIAYYDIIYETAGDTWASYDPADTWADVNPLLTWQTADLLIGDIDRPGDFELADYAGGSNSALNSSPASSTIRLRRIVRIARR